MADIRLDHGYRLTHLLECIVCKTCSDYNHICQGYSEPSAHARSQSDAASRTPTIAPLPPPSDATALRAARKAASRSPSSPRRTIVPITDGADKPSEALKLLEPKEEPLPTDTSSRTTKDLEQQNNGASPESSMLWHFSSFSNVLYEWLWLIRLFVV